MRILVRGDCCSQRAITMNPELFGYGPTLIQDEKATVKVMLERLQGVLPDSDAALRLLDEEAMDSLDRYYFLSQFGRATLDAAPPDLIVMDCYADMNFKLWRHRVGGWHMWIKGRYIGDWDAYNAAFEFVGRTTLEAAVADTAELIAHYRRGDNSIPLIYLTQPIGYFPKLEKRRDFGRLGELMRERIPNLFFGGDLRREQLDPEDRDELGRTLHFTGSTYRTMLNHASAQGLDLARLKARGFGRTIAYSEHGDDAVSVDELLRRSGLPTAALAPARMVDPSVTPDCAAECGKFVEIQFTEPFDDHMAAGCSRDGWDRRYLPLALAVGEATDEDGCVAPAVSGFLASYVPCGGRRFLIAPLGSTALDAEATRIDSGLECGNGFKTPTPPRHQRDTVVAVAPRDPACPVHWSRYFGLFAGVDDEPGEVILLAVLWAMRCGDILYVSLPARSALVGQCEADLLMHDIIRRGNEQARFFAGVRTIFSGAVFGDPMVFAERVRFGFRPMRLFFAEPHPIDPSQPTTLPSAGELAGAVDPARLTADRRLAWRMRGLWPKALARIAALGPVISLLLG